MEIFYYVLIGLLLIGLIYFVYYLVSKSIEKDAKMLQSIKEVLDKHGRLKDEGQNLFIKYEYNNELYTLMFLKLSPEYKFQFNSKTIWERRKGGNKFFIDNKVFASIPGKKMVIIYPHTGPFMYHYDENEIRFTKPKEKIWDMHIIPAHILEEVLKEGL